MFCYLDYEYSRPKIKIVSPWIPCVDQFATDVVEKGRQMDNVEHILCMCTYFPKLNWATVFTSEIAVDEYFSLLLKFWYI